MFNGESGTGIQLFPSHDTMVLHADLPPAHAISLEVVHTTSQQREVWRVITTTSDVGNVTQGPGVLHHQELPISGAQHFQAFCHWFVLFFCWCILPTATAFGRGPWLNDICQGWTGSTKAGQWGHTSFPQMQGGVWNPRGLSFVKLHFHPEGL